MEDSYSQAFTDEDDVLHRPILATAAVVMYLITGGIAGFLMGSIGIVIIFISFNDPFGFVLCMFLPVMFALLLVYVWTAMCVRLLNGRSSDLMLPAALNLSVGFVLLSTFIIYAVMMVIENRWHNALDESVFVGITVCSWLMLSGILGFAARDRHMKWAIQRRQLMNDANKK